MINNFYSSISNGNIVDKCSHKQHHVPELPYLLKNNFLSEFRTALEKAKVRVNLGIADSETLFWGNILGDIAEQKDIAAYINSLLAFDYSILHDFDAGDNFENVKNVRDAAITCLDYLSKFKGEGAEILALGIKIKEILRNLYAVDNLDEVETSQGGVINELISNVQELKALLGNPNTTVKDIENKLGEVEEKVNQVNNTLSDINSLLVRYEPTDGSSNALLIIEDKIKTELRPKVDEEGNPILDESGDPIMESVEIIEEKGGLYVKDLQPLIDAIAGESGILSQLETKIDENTQGITENKLNIDSLTNTVIPGINLEIESIKNDYVSKDSLGSSSPIITEDKLKDKLSDFVKKDSTASLQGITSQNETIKILKPLEFGDGLPGDFRRYVLKKEDLLKVTNYWPGMEVIVIEDALMYILKEHGDPSDPTYDGWKIADSLKIEVLSRLEFEERQKAGDLNPLVYYYIYSESITFKEYPKRSDYATDEEFEYAEQLWRDSAFILQGQYMSAAWGLDIDNRLKYKVDKANFDLIVNKVGIIENFFNSTDGDTLSSLKESIQQIYKPAFVETDASGKPVEKPASGMLVTLSDKVNQLDSRVTALEESGFVKWDDIGAGNAIVTDNKLSETLQDYIQKDTIGSLEGITSKNETIRIDKPLSMETGLPIDPRRYVETYLDLYTVDPKTAYKGMEVIVKSEGIIMMLQDLNNISNDNGWKNVGLASIVEITLEEYKLRLDNTNEDGSSKGMKYKDTGEPIPTLVGNVYYFIKEAPITFKELPERGNKTDEEWISDLQTWKQDTYLLWHMFLTASWGEDMSNRVNNKADLAEFVANKRVTEENKKSIENILELLETLNGYFESTSDVKISEIISTADQLRKDFDNLVIDHNSVKLDLYGDTFTKPKFVTWAALGGEDDEALEGGKTLFVKTTIYEADRLADSKEFTTEKLTFPGTKTIHYEAVEELSHIDEVSGEKIIDVEGKEAYDEVVNDPLSVTRKNNRLLVGSEEVAFKDDLLKTVEFDSYPIYFNWINGSGTIDGKEGSQTYNEWILDKDLNLWYFLIKYDGTVLPPKNPDETLDEYEVRLEPFKKGMLVTAYDAERIFATKSALQGAASQLAARINSEELRLNNLENYVDESLNTLNLHIGEIEEDFKNTCELLKQEYTYLNTLTLSILYTAWGRYYNPDANSCLDLGAIVDQTETSLTRNIVAFLKKWTTAECERISARKLEESTFKLIWDTYYTLLDGIITYTPLKTLIANIVGDESSPEALTLSSLKAQIDLRETIENHENDITAVRKELTDNINTLKQHSDLMATECLLRAIETCLNAEPISYFSLKYLRDVGGLVPGRSYRITDYKTTSKESNTKVIWHPFDVIVTADSKYVLSEIAYAAIPDVCKALPANENSIEDELGNVTYVDVYYRNCNLEAWELRYTLDNDSSRYSWADDRYLVLEAFNEIQEGTILFLDLYKELSETNKAKCELIGRGVIYYMKDEFGNECSYDFKSILFERFYISALTSLKSMSEWIINNYYSPLSVTLESQETIIPHYKSLNKEGNTTRFFYTFDSGKTAVFTNIETGLPETRPVELTWDNANNNINTCRDNHFAYPCNLYNVVQNGVGITILIDKNKIVLNNNVFIGNNFVSNTCTDLGFAYNTILDGMSFNTIAGNFAFNIIANNFTNNKIGYDCKLNIINSGFNYNSIGNKFLKNCINTVCENNIFRELFVNNALSHHETENIFGNNIHDCDFPDYFKNNELGGDTVELKIIETAHYMLFCYFSKGIHLLRILDSQQRSGPANWYQYIHFNWSSFSTLTNIDLCNGDFLGSRNNFSITPGNKYIIEILDSSTPGLGYVWCPADIIDDIKYILKLIAAVNQRIDTVELRLNGIDKKITNLELNMAAELAFSDSIAEAVRQLATYHNAEFELKRPQVN